MSSEAEALSSQIEKLRDSMIPVQKQLADAIRLPGSVSDERMGEMRSSIASTREQMLTLDARLREFQKADTLQQRKGQLEELRHEAENLVPSVQRYNAIAAQLHGEFKDIGGSRAARELDAKLHPHVNVMPQHIAEA
jgi:chromosome segregation ATPase